MTAARVLVTGGTGFLGRHVVERLVDRGAEVWMLARRADSRRTEPALAALFERAARTGTRLHLVEGDITTPTLFADPAAAPLRLDHVIHAAALYDLGGSVAALEAANVDGTRHLLSWLDATGFDGVLHHVSSIAVAGDYAGRFEEHHLDEGQRHSHAYHRTKFESERLVREAKGLRWRIYRPSAVVGHSQTGVADRVDGPYFYFKPIQKLARALPAWFPLYGRKVAPLNMVPVDFVAAAIDHLAHADGLDGQVFHLVDPDPPAFDTMFNLFSAAANGPRLRRSKLVANLLGAGAAMSGGKLGGVAFYRREQLRDFGVPPETLEAINDRVTYGATATTEALRGSGVTCPPLRSYAEAIWDYWARHLDPDRDPDGKARRALAGRRVLVTGGSSGIGAAFGRRCAALGAEVILVARRGDALEDVCREVREAGGMAHAYVADLSVPEDIDALVGRVLAERGPVDVLVNNAGHSIRRPLEASAERFHDFERLMQLNYFGSVRLTLGLLPAMRERGFGHIVQVLSAGTVIVPPRFGQYQASKAALNAFSDALVAEHLHEGIFTTSVYMPLVRTPMMEATDAYAKQTGVLTPDDGAELILDGVVNRRRRVMDLETLRRSLLMFVAPSFMSRVLNVLYRAHPDEPGAHPELDPDRALLKRYLGDFKL